MIYVSIVALLILFLCSIYSYDIYLFSHNSRSNSSPDSLKLLLLVIYFFICVPILVILSLIIHVSGLLPLFFSDCLRDLESVSWLGATLSRDLNNM